MFHNLRHLSTIWMDFVGLNNPKEVESSSEVLLDTLNKDLEKRPRNRVSHGKVFFDKRDEGFEI